MASVSHALPAPRAHLARRRITRIIFWALILGWPWIAGAAGQIGVVASVNLASIAVLAALSIVILTGWVGQISLCQAAFLGMGAYTAGQVQNHFGIAFPWHLLLGGAVGGLTALVIGIPALRLRGLYLAIATLTFQWAMENSFFQFTWFAGGLDGVRIRAPIWGPRGGLFEFDLANQRIFYYFAWATVLVLVVLAANLRDSKIGRAWFAIRGSETAARTLGIDVTRYKLVGFVFSGFYAGVAGGILINWVSLVTFDQFLFDKSLTYLATAVLGGIVQLVGSFIAGLSFAGINDLIHRLPEAGGLLPIFVGLIVITTILLNPGGLAHSAEELRHKLAARRSGRSDTERIRAQARAAAARIFGHEPPPEAAAERPGGDGFAARSIEESRFAGALESADTGGPAAQTAGDGRAASSLLQLRPFAHRELPAKPKSAPREEAEAALRVDNITVRFGGVVACDEVALEVRRGEIVGLIGPNGAGKTTLFNVVSGIVRQERGTVAMLGRDVSSLAVHQRARFGLGRTFQLIRLFPRLTVYQNLMVGTHIENPAGFWSNLFLTGRARSAEAKARGRVDEVIDFLGLRSIADQTVANLPFGILRMVELARALVLRPKVLLLDEAASGLDTDETDHLARILLDIRDRFETSILLIEHDMRLVMMVSDYVYVLDFGKLLAEGPPATVQSDERVVHAYLGEQEEPVAVG